MSIDVSSSFGTKYGEWTYEINGDPHEKMSRVD